MLYDYIFSPSRWANAISILMYMKQHSSEICTILAISCFFTWLSSNTIFYWLSFHLWSHFDVLLAQHHSCFYEYNKIQGTIPSDGVVSHNNLFALFFSFLNGLAMQNIVLCQHIKFTFFYSSNNNKNQIFVFKQV